MSRIDRLIRALCPDGVDFRLLGAAVSVVPTPRGILREHYSWGSLIPIVDQGQALIAGYTDDRSLALDAGEVIVFGDHTRAVKWIDFMFAPGADGIKVLRANAGLIPKFLYYAISNMRVESRGYNRHWTLLRELPVPTPPLEVQREIVRVLDTFAALEAELEAELEARRRQYAHYRESLLAPDDEDRSNWVRMGDVGQFIRGRRFTKSDVVTDGIASIHYGEIYTSYGVSARRALTAVNPELRSTLRFAKPGDIVIAAVGETVEDVCKAVAWLGDEDVAIHDDCFAYRHSLNPKFVAYYMQTAAFHDEKAQYVARAKVKRMSGENLAKLHIPVPSVDEQERVVAILDAFDVLVSDLSVGLPAELAARRKQYEHYRDRLLTFPEAS